MRLTLAAVLGLCLLAPLAHAARPSAGDFPPGVFSDGGQYSVSDYEGKVLVLFFYEQECPRCRGLIPQRNAVVEQYRDKPVKFIAIGAGDTPQQCSMYVNSTHLAMPSFADSLSIMEKRYNTGRISLNNIWQFRVIGPDGKVVANDMTAEAIDSALKNAKWRFKDQGFDPKLAAAVEQFEYKQWEAGMKFLRPHLKSSNKPLAESAQKLFSLIKQEGEKWKADAENAVADGKPAEAFLLYTKIAAVFAGDDLAKATVEPLKKLRADKQVKDELEAQKMFAQLAVGISRATPAQAREAADFAASIAKKYPGTPTAAKADQIAADLAGPAAAE